MNNATFTHELYQTELGSEDLEYVVEQHQPYFEFEIRNEKFLIGLDKILECIIIAEKIEEIPKLGNGFWTSILEKFNINYYDYDVKLTQE